jgi:outer membrane protein assembly factor BamA
VKSRAALFALSACALLACDDEVIPPSKTPNRVSLHQSSPAERRDAACKAKSLPSRDAIKTNEGVPEIPQGNVARVDVDGASDAAAARAAIGIAAGEPLTLEKTQAAIRKLYALGDVDDVRLDIAKTSQGAVLHFVIDKRAKLGEVVLHGGSIDDAPELEKALHATSGAPYDPAMLMRTRATLVDALHDRGYSDATLAVTGERAQDGVVDLCVDLHEGSKITIDSIKFIGLSRIKETELSSTLDTDHGRINAVGGVIDQNKIDEAVAKMAEVFDARGLAKGTISTKTTRNGDKVSLVFEIEEGPVVLIRRYDIKGDLVADAGTYHRLMSIKPKDVFSRAHLMADLKKIGELHEKKNRADLVIEPQTQLDDKNNTVDVVLVVVDPKKVQQQQPPPAPPKK